VPSNILDDYECWGWTRGIVDNAMLIMSPYVAPLIDIAKGKILGK